MRHPSNQPSPGTLNHDELDDRLPGLDPVTAVYFAALPVIRTLTTVVSSKNLKALGDWATHISQKAQLLAGLVRTEVDGQAVLSVLRSLPDAELLHVLAPSFHKWSIKKLLKSDR